MPPSIVEADVTVGHGSIIGYDSGRGLEPCRLGLEVRIGCFCVVERGAVLDPRVVLDHYCRVGGGSSVGAETRLLYGSQIFDDVAIGARCIIGGVVDDRTVIEDDVTYMGTMAHSYRRPGSIDDWDVMVQPSIVIRRRAVIGQNAVLVGGIEIGEEAYVAAGEVVRSDIPAGMVLLRGQLTPLERFRGLIRPRVPPEAGVDV